MKFDDTIFDVIKYHEANYSHTLTNNHKGPTNYELIVPLVRKEHPRDSYESVAEYEQRIKDEMDYYLLIGILPAHGILANAIRAYERHLEISLHLHQLHLNDKDYLVFLTHDLDYDMVEIDLLDCDWEVNSRVKFLNYINSDEYNA
ncbi:hypothetical protein ACYATO_08715 [Lactobacillaceae bacterium Melli_B3]